MTPTSIRRLVWGVTIFGAGIILLLQAVALIPGDAWKIIWPTFIVIIGLEMVLTTLFQYGEEEVKIELPKHLFNKRRKGKR